MHHSAARFLTLCLYIFILLPLGAHSTDYYLSAAGNDQQEGTSPALAWKTIDRLNAAGKQLRPGDNIFFRRGDLFYGTIRVTASGTKEKPIVFGAYGAGADPVISGFSVPGAWTNEGNGIWSADAPQAASGLNMVCMQGTPQRIGRYPNTDANDGGYLRYEDAAGNLSITDQQLSTSTDWTGAEVVIRKNHWTAERCRITRQEGKTINYTYANEGINPIDEPYLYPGLKNNGYFIQNDLRTLDQPGEWYMDTIRQRLYMYAGNTAPVRVQYSSRDTLVNTGSRSGLVFRNLQFEGANRSGLFNRGGGSIHIISCRFRNIGAKAIHCWNTPDVLIDSVDTYFVLSNAIQVRNRQMDNVIVRNCRIRQTGPYVGMGSFYDARDYKAIGVQVQRNLVIENNVVDSSGLTGIEFQGSNALVQHNLVTHFCYVLDDGAGIYTYVDASPENPGPPFVNRTIRNNIILYGTGASQGSIYKAKAEGIYLDAGTMNMMVLNNTIAHLSYRAIACNNPKDVLIRGNTCFNTGLSWGIARPHVWRTFGNVEMKDNIFCPLTEQQHLGFFSYNALNNPEDLSIWEAMRSTGEIDSNWYATPNPFAFQYNFSPAENKPFVYPSPLTLEQWKEFSGLDAHSGRPVRQHPAFKVDRLMGSNLIAGGQFEENIRSVKVNGNAVEASHDNSSQLSGKGSLRISCKKAESNRFVQVACAAGRIRKSGRYLLRFRSAGNSDCGMIRVFLRSDAAPYPVMSSIHTLAFTAAPQQHELLLEATAEGDCSLVIEIGKSACVTFLDDIELTEAAARVFSPQERVRFEYNATAEKKTIPLERKYYKVDGTDAGDALILPPFSSAVLFPE